LFLSAAVCQAHIFECTDFSVPPPPKTIKDLHPGHVSLVMAMGDSITAAFAARGTLMESRDISWSIGVGTADQLTMPYMLNQYASHNGLTLEGMSTTSVVPNDIFHLPHNDYHDATDHMNVAESSGAVHRGSVEEQWGFLLNNFPKYHNFQQRWKVMTIWMSANDVCGECNGAMDFTNYLAKMNQLMANISSTLGNVLINLVSTLDLSNIARIQRKNTLCAIEHSFLHECGCIDKGNAKQLAQLDVNVHAMNGHLHAMAAFWQQRFQAQGRTDIALVVQGFQEGIGAQLDRSFLSTLDCFHPSTVGHQSLAVGLWNSMLCTSDRASRCGQRFSINMPATCPTKDSVFYTGPDVPPSPQLAMGVNQSLNLGSALVPIDCGLCPGCKITCMSQYQGFMSGCVNDVNQEQCHLECNIQLKWCLSQKQLCPR